MKYLPRSIKNLIEEFSKLPCVGPKTAERFTFSLLKKQEKDLEKFADTIRDFKKNLKNCTICHNIAESDPCDICSNPTRDKSTIAVVEKSLDIVALEKTGQFKGTYHVLGGSISPIDGVTAADLTIDKLVEKVKKREVTELILATNPTLEGESTASYIQQLIKPVGIKITRIARGIPVGGDLEYADEVTIIRALEGRKEY